MTKRRVVIAGASRGLGHELSLGYLNRGWEVWAGCRTPLDADHLARRGAVVRQLDIVDEDSVEAFAAEVSVAPVDVLINAAGIDARSLGADQDARGPFELSLENFVTEVRVNAGGPMLVTRALLSALLRSDSPKVINLSSRTSSMVVGGELCWDIGYNASKAALNAITVRTARLLSDRGVIVVALHPGWVRTDMGGPDATLEPAGAARALINTIDGLEAKQSGLLLHPDGSAHPW